MDQKKKMPALAGWLPAVMLLVYFGAVCAVNLSGVPGFYDADMYTDIRYAMEAWTHKSVFPEGWVFGNQLYVASTPVLAAFVYGLTGAPHLSMGIASTVMTVLVLLSFQWMLRPVVSSRQGRVAGSVLFMGTMLFFGDAWHNTGGWQLMFTMCSYYACYAVNVFLTCGCYLRGNCLNRLWPMLVLTCLLSFCTGIQSLRQTAVMTLPLLGVEALHILHNALLKKKADKQTLGVTACISAANLTGLVTARCLDLEQVEIIGELNLEPLSHYPANLVDGILQAVSLVVNHNAAGYLMLGMILLVCAAAVVIVLVRRNLKGLTLFTLLLFGVLAILAVDVMTTMLVRPIYYFMVFPLLAFLGAYFFDAGGKWGKGALLVILTVLFCFSCIRELPDLAERIRNKESESACEISDYLQEQGYFTIYAAWNQGSDVAIASDWKISVGFWEYAEDPFFYYKYLCNPEIFRADSEDCVYLFYGEEYAQLAVEKAKTMQIEMELLHHFPDSDIYLYTASENIMEAFW